MTNSKMPSSNEEAKESLHLFLEGKLTLDSLLNKLSKQIIVEFPSSEGARKILRNDLEGVISLEFKPHHLSNMLKKYLEGRFQAITIRLVRVHFSIWYFCARRADRRRTVGSGRGASLGYSSTASIPFSFWWIRHFESRGIFRDIRRLKNGIILHYCCRFAEKLS
jgi:hypothetical protein